MTSNDSRKYGNSRVSNNSKAMATVGSKHLNMVEQKFGQSEDSVSRMTNEKITKTNDQIREMIKKFNEELNELINKNMVMLKDKSPAKTVSVENKLRVMEEQLKSGSTA